MPQFALLIGALLFGVPVVGALLFGISARVNAYGYG